MNQMTSNRKTKKTPSARIILRAFICLAVLAAGAAAMKYFAAGQKKPRMAEPKEQVIQVQVKKAVPENVPVTLEGFGVAEPVDSVTISSQVSGNIVWTSSLFKPGARVAENKVLFKIDPVNYQIARDKARALVMERKQAMERLEKERRSDGKRIKTLKRTRDLAKAEYQRIKRLFQQDSVGNASQVDKAEQAFNTARDNVDQLAVKIDLYPVAVKEAKTRLASAKADLLKAETDLDRCTARAPFDCRITEVALEKGEYASPGKAVLTIADDAFLEINVSLDADKASRWLKFQQGETAAPGWFPEPVPVTCPVRWTETPDSPPVQGNLHRIVEFNRESRTITCAVRINTGKGKTENVPLVAGMFCSVAVPGKVIEDLYRVPSWSVTTENTVYIARDNRLETRHITRAYDEEGVVFISKGIKPGEIIVTTRLVDPMENALLTFSSVD
ncbi:MAG TPA: HlyD family efflux transporter periplasmic adaptor subunit [Desulfobacteraceae bacterium]|nr:HlyD family efflux transporter periplasmic adaptor subunit [Desulfobacteraceae bacterium]